jgi:lactoylglutathione lyase
MHITGAHHIALHTTNFAPLRRFYVEILGLRVVGGFPGENIIFLQAGNFLIELEEVEEHGDAIAPRNGWDHLALEVDDVDAAYQRLTALGVPFNIPPTNYPEQAGTMRIAFFTDPDGNTLELLQPLVGNGYTSHT